HFENRYTSTLVTWDASTLNVIQKYRSLIDVLILPVSALLNWLILARPKLNYVETLCVSFYLFSFTFIFHIAHITITSFLGIHYKDNTGEYITAVFVGIWAIYACYDFYKLYKTPFLIPKLIVWIIAAFPAYFYAGKMIAKLLVAIGF